MESPNPQLNDVLFGKGTAINTHPGNKHLRSIVDRRKNNSSGGIKRNEKRIVAEDIVDEIQKLGGRFLMEDPNNGGTNNGDLRRLGRSNNDSYEIHPCILHKVWIGVEREKVITKVMHRLREKGATGKHKQQTSDVQQQQRTLDLKSKSQLSGWAISEDAILSPHHDKCEDSANTDEKESGVQLGTMANPDEAEEAKESTLDDIKSSSELEAGDEFLPQIKFGATSDVDSTIPNQNELEAVEEFLPGITFDATTDIDSVKPNQSELEAGDEFLRGVTFDAITNFNSIKPNQSELEASDEFVPGVTFDAITNVNSIEPNQSELEAGDEFVPGIKFGTLPNVYSADEASDPPSIIQYRESGDSLPDQLVRVEKRSSDRRQLKHGQNKLELGQPGTESFAKNSIDLNQQVDENIGLQYKEEAKIAANFGVNSMGLLDEKLGHFLLNFSAHHDTDTLPSEEEHEVTLREWIKKSKPRFTSGYMGYTKAALPIALKLTECLIEAERDGKDGDGNPIPLASIAAANVLMRSKEFYSRRGSPDSCEHAPSNLTNLKEAEQSEEVIEYVWIMSCIGDSPGSGGITQRLLALGLVLYELFFGEDPSSAGFSNLNVFANLLSLNSINLGNNFGNNFRPKKRAQSSEDDVSSKCIDRLKCMGNPHSICALVGNLLDCSQGDASSDEAYSSLDDLHFDLQLMINNPQRFLHNIETSPLPQLLICKKLFGREEELEKLDQAYHQNIKGECSGVIIKGKAGVGKSTLAMHVRELSSKSKGYFLVAKFDQNKDVQPLATISSLLNSLCNLFVQDATDAQLKAVVESLERDLGAQAVLLAKIIPNLAKLLGSYTRPRPEHSSNWLSMSFLFSELLRVISSHSRHISLFLDDMHWSDPASLLLVGSLISSHKGSNSMFFTCSYRDDEVDGNGPFNQWLSSMPSSLKTIKLENISVNGVNMLVSDALHLSPRLTRPLSSVLHHKAGGGNPLFVKQLFDALKENGYIYVNLSHPKWEWDLDKIANMEISDDVVALLIDEMQKLCKDLQWGLKVASCIGSRVKKPILDILSQDLGHNMINILHQVSLKGFMTNAGGTMFSFSHDKIQQAAYELMSDQQRRENHMRFGLAICATTNAENDELFFTSLNQINRGSSSVLSNPDQRRMIAALNLKAGKRSIGLSDMNSAFKLFQHGISFLGDDHWANEYELSIKLYDAVSDAASVINNWTAVTFYTKQLLAHARCSDDKLSCMYAAAKALSNQGLQQETVESSFDILLMLGEQLPRRMEGTELSADIDNMNDNLVNNTDETFLNMKENKQKKFDTLMQLYRLLAHNFHYYETSLFEDTSLRMVTLTLTNGLCLTSPLAFAYYGELLVSIGKLDLGVRIGGLALKLANKKGCLRTKAQVISAVYQTVFWLSTPLQSISDAHFTGYRAGQQSGAFLISTLNHLHFLFTNYVTGQCLNKTRENCRESALKISRSSAYFYHVSQLHLQSCVFIEGVHILDLESIDNLPGEPIILERRKQDPSQSLGIKIFRLARTLLFRQFDDVPNAVNSVLGLVLEKKVRPHPMILFGIFCEGLLSYQFARQTKDQDSFKWIGKGESALCKMKCWDNCCSWNFQNKVFLLEAEKKFALEDFDEAESLYKSSIRSSNEHKFIHEEAIASELAGFFYYERGLHAKSYSFFMHSIQCYEKWGANAVARRVERSVQSQFGSHWMQLGPIDDSLVPIFASEGGPTKKRQSSEMDSFPRYCDNFG